MKKEVTKIDVLQAGLISAILYALLSFVMLLMYVPFLGLFMSATGGNEELREAMPFMGLGIVGLLIGGPILYGILGGLMGLIGAALYNLVAGWVGGYKITLKDVIE